MLRAVNCYSVPYLILNNQHTQLFKLLAELFNVIADNTVIYIYICTVIKHV